ncbi:MAG: PEGA domain-containing protein, partial [Bacteroidales bacterium]|nr:PEGA domain-containing protein [Bacteroidales bacterium]
YINDEPLGRTPYTYTDTKIVGSTNIVRLELEGYEPLYTSFSRNEEVDPGAIIGGILVWVPFLWTMKYKPSHFYELKPITDIEY